MAFFDVDFTYKIEEYGTISIEASDELEAEMLTREHIRETYSDAIQVSIDEVKEIK